jgi:hypothetical protein
MIAILAARSFVVIPQVDGKDADDWIESGEPSSADTRDIDELDEADD